MDKHPAPKTGISLNAFYSVMQLRTDGWQRLKDYCVRLAEEGNDHAKWQGKVQKTLKLLAAYDSYWAFPSPQQSAFLQQLFDNRRYQDLSRAVFTINRALASLSYRHKPVNLTRDDSQELPEQDDYYESQHERDMRQLADKPYFEVLVVDNITPVEEERLRAGLRKMRQPDDPFIYEIVVVPSFEDAIIASLFNFNLQAAVIRYSFPFRSAHRLEMLNQLLEDFKDLEGSHDADFGPVLGNKLAEIRPEWDLYLVTDTTVENIAGQLGLNFRRVFYREEDYLELNTSILRGVNRRYETPFFTALKKYSQQPTGVFHALPISRAKSIIKSSWIQDMLQFYGPSIFMAETSATSGGLDSLLDPTGTLKQAQKFAARAFGARHTFFVTNGTSTGNKIVVQALVEPGDIVLVDHNCHKSHHYGMVLSGAQVAYLDSFPLEQFTMYGAVPLRHIKQTLLTYRRHGLLPRVKMLLLTNCTFDGVIYDVQRVMEECLAIKPDLIFLWDEAWFAFAGFHPTTRQRTAMYSAKHLQTRYRSDGYRKKYQQFQQTMAAAAKESDQDSDQLWLDQRLMPDPDQVRIRVYATQSTHKRLTALRQGSMIHIFDQEYKLKVEDAFHEAYMTHTSTSPNYQILASLDIGRRQCELEGFELVQRQTELSMTLRQAINSHPALNRYFRTLTFTDLIPSTYRPSGIEFYHSPSQGWARMESAWRGDEFVLEPSHINLYIGRTGIDGDTFKHDYLMDQYGIQVNKTSRNTVLFMVNIGTTRSSVAYLIEVLVKIAQSLEEEQIEALNASEQKLHQQKVKSLTTENPPLPDFSYFHPYFRSHPETPDGNLRDAFFMAYKDSQCQYMTIDRIETALAEGQELVSAMFVTPYPPGFPILVPGQVVTQRIIDFMRALDTREIHGYRPELGFRLFQPHALQPCPLSLEES